jgi:deoxyhypusine synthase
MQELIQQLQEKAGLNAEQAAKAIDVMKDFVKSKVPPFIGDTVDKWFAGMGSPTKEKETEQNDDFLDG